MYSRMLTGLLFLMAPALAQTVADSSAAMPHAQSINMGWVLAKAILSLLLIIGLIFLSVYLLRKYVYRGYQSGSASEGMRILSQIQIQPKKFVALMQVYNRVLVVGITDAAMHTLTEFNDEESVRTILSQVEHAPDKWTQHKFLEMFKKNLQSKNS